MGVSQLSKLELTNSCEINLENAKCTHLRLNNVFFQACEWGSWGSWSDCSANCGSGTRTRTRSKIRTELLSKLCDGDSSESETCTGPPCPVSPDNCEGSTDPDCDNEGSG